VGPDARFQCVSDPCEQEDTTSLDGIRFEDPGQLYVRDVAMIDYAADSKGPADPVKAFDIPSHLSPIPIVPSPYLASIGLDAVRICAVPRVTGACGSDPDLATRKAHMAIALLFDWRQENPTPLLADVVGGTADYTKF